MSSVKLLFDFINRLETDDKEFENVAKAYIEQNGDNSYSREKAEYYNGRVRAFQLIKQMMKDHYFPEELKDFEGYNFPALETKLSNQEPLTV